MFIKNGDALPISIIANPADVSDEGTKKQLKKAIDEAKTQERKDEKQESK
jgi:hypothetical protein